MQYQGFEHRGKMIFLTMDDEHIYNHINHYRNFYEHWLLESISVKGGTMIDCGSNFGNHAVYFDKFCKADKVIAIEPIMDNYELLCLNMVQNNCSSIVPILAGVGDNIKFVGFKNNGRNSQYSLTSGGGNIPVITIDSLDIDDCTLLKIDTEGMEVKVLQGAINTIQKCKPDIYIECFGDRTEIESILMPIGYKLIQRYNHAPTYHYSCRELDILYVEP